MNSSELMQYVRTHQDTDYKDNNSNTIGQRSDVTAAVDYAYKTIDMFAQYARAKTDGFLSALFQVSPQDFCNFNTINGIIRLKLMQINDNEKSITMNALGTNAAIGGDSTAIPNYMFAPSYAAKRNYVENFVKDINKSDPQGIDSTRRHTNSDQAQHPLDMVRNLFYDEQNSNADDFTTADEISFNNPESILSKTKRLFNERKINTIISRYYTGDGSQLRNHGSSATRFGLSHGRNLLTYDAEHGGDGYDVNGYKNPYCRVWTHHAQYSKIGDMIRSFITKEGKVMRPQEFHNWGEFKNMVDLTKINAKGFNNWGMQFTTKLLEVMNDNDKKSTWKHNNESAWEKSVLNTADGRVNITPKYQGGGVKNIHTKQCMFSIENLAWRGFDPYQFEKALSWEQRGPLGGRIMWFPPYGISFNETTTANWSNNTFIGRGEDVFTYINTQRSGTLSFMMVVDHPSIVDYLLVNGSGTDEAVSENDLLRFFAGCGLEISGVAKGYTTTAKTTVDYGTDGKSDKQVLYGDAGNVNKGSMLERVKPTPLTDEYEEYTPDAPPEYETIEVEERRIESSPQETVPDEQDTIVFYVFYPNNYSGAYDRDGQTDVDPIAYLLGGIGAQKQGGGKHPEDKPISFDDDVNTWSVGYEMTKRTGVTPNDINDNFIVGTKDWGAYKGGTTYVDVPSKKWYYRIDGKYEVPTDEDKKTSNTYCQTLLKADNYKDRASYCFNSSKENVVSAFNEDSQTCQSLANIAAAIMRLTNEQQSNDFIDKYGLEKEDIYKIYDTFTNRKLNSIKCEGFSNSHANNASSDINAKRNIFLAKQRAETVKSWLQKHLTATSDDVWNSESGFNPSTPVDNIDKTKVDGKSSKKYRSARIELGFEKTKQEDVMDISEEEVYSDNELVNVDAKGVVQRTFTKIGDNLYIDEDGLQWRYEKDKDGHKGKLVCTQASVTVLPSQTRNRFDTKTGQGERNYYRYDQEYHFFKALEKNSPLVAKQLKEKLRYFDPAFHSMTPEGFNARLAFLHQCTRQGDTVGASDPNGKSANNLAFGRPPFCVLRLGDFYNQMIVINSININYDPLQWDLNIEGIGAQPLLAHITISFNFIGGGDMAGPVQRLQNAMSFNYYANQRLYDNRADEPVYESRDAEKGDYSGKIVPSETKVSNIIMRQN